MIGNSVIKIKNFEDYTDSGESISSSNYENEIQEISDEYCRSETNTEILQKEENLKLQNAKPNEQKMFISNNGNEKSIQKKKKRKRRVAICLTNCRYEVVRRTAAKFGMREVSESDNWDIYWTDLSISIERAKDMRRFQRVNHFPGMLEICRKDLLARNLNRMLKLYPRDYGFFPKTWCFPADLGDALAYNRLRKNRTYILKPDAGSQGRGIFLTRSLKDIKPTERMICQVYLSKPFLIDGYKFDLRVYTLITSCDPLRVYVYNEGLARFATSRYREPTGNNTTNVFMHLTNYAVNKHSRTYNMNDESGSKRKISSLNRYLVAMGYDVQELWENIDEVIVKTIISAWPILKHSYHACFPSHNLAYACFELLGFDILLDHKLKPYVLEVNHSPSFHCDTLIDSEVKTSLLYDTFVMLDISRIDKRKILEEDRRRVRGRLLQGIIKDQLESNDDLSSVTTEPYIIQDKWESSHLGGYRQAYPGLKPTKYAAFFQQTQSSLYSQTVASKARDTAARIQRQELETKTKLEAAKRVTTTSVTKNSNDKGPSENNLLSPIPHNKNANIKQRKLLGSEKSSSNYCNSFQPGIIIESEEKERMASLAQRDLLIRNYGLLQQIYFAMKMNGSLRLEDQKKYAQFTSQNVTKMEEAPLYTLKKSSVIVPQMINISKQSAPVSKNLPVVVNEANMYKRPQFPNKSIQNSVVWGDVRSTKTHVARSLTNTAHLIALTSRNENKSESPSHI